ncbi:MAG: VanZ family protein [Dissulfurispiraceae bacterium]
MASNRNLTYWVLVVFWLCFIFVLSGKSFTPHNTRAIIEPIMHWLVSGISAKTLSFVQQVLRKLAHVIEYYVLGFLLFRAFYSVSAGSRSWHRILPAVIVLLPCAVGDELHQSFVPGRTASFIDVGLDTASGVFAQMVSILQHYRTGVQESGRRDDAGP